MRKAVGKHYKISCVHIKWLLLNNVGIPTLKSHCKLCFMYWNNVSKNLRRKKGTIPRNMSRPMFQNLKLLEKLSPESIGKWHWQLYDFVSVVLYVIIKLNHKTKSGFKLKLGQLECFTIHARGSVTHQTVTGHGIPKTMLTSR